MIVGAVLAAGGSERFGSPKQLAELHGRPLLSYPIEALRAVPAIDAIVVVLGAHAKRIRADVDLGGVEVVITPDWHEGIAASLRAAVAAASEAEMLVVVLGDQPLITPQVISTVIDRSAGPQPATRATFGGRPGHPVAIKRTLFAELERLRGDEGARNLLEAHGVIGVGCETVGVSADVDTVEDLYKLRQRT